MTRQQLIEQIYLKKSFLCVGLDTDINKIPPFLLNFEDPVFEFNKRIIDATKDIAVAYKPNIAFYECMGEAGWRSLKKTIDYIPENIFTIADAKRGDIGNTSNMYAKTFFETYEFDSVTINPYMGEDSVTPFLAFENKWAIVLAVTSNLGSKDFQFMRENNQFLYERVIEKCHEWGNEENIMFVTGATNAKELANVRKLAPKSFFLVPGVGAQGGDLHEVVKYGRNEDIGLLINSSRAIIYASSDKDFESVAHEKAREVQLDMRKYL
jgi:orotidine-5'-phosphate decarboxylase